MYESLRDLSQDLLLPGLEAVLPDSVLGLETNRRFVEAFMVGLNFEMARELLWRGFPTDQRGTYFEQFWGGGAGDIDPLHLWRQPGAGRSPQRAAAREIRDAGAQRPAAPLSERGDLSDACRRKATGQVRTPSEDPADEKLPVFACSMQPDIAFFGFDVTAEQATGEDGGAGYYVVIQEHPTEPRFGLHTGVSVGNVSHVPVGTAAPANQPLNGLAWGRNSAHMAGIVRRLPVRLAIHASLFLPARRRRRHRSARRGSAAGIIARSNPLRSLSHERPSVREHRRARRRRCRSDVLSALPERCRRLCCCQCVSEHASSHSPAPRSSCVYACFPTRSTSTRTSPTCCRANETGARTTGSRTGGPATTRPPAQSRGSSLPTASAPRARGWIARRLTPTNAQQRPDCARASRTAAAGCTGLPGCDRWCRMARIRHGGTRRKRG